MSTVTTVVLWILLKYAIWSLLRELTDLPYVKSCIALCSKQPKGATSASKGAKKERKSFNLHLLTKSEIWMIHIKLFKRCMILIFQSQWTVNKNNYYTCSCFLFTAVKPVPKDKGVAGVLGKSCDKRYMYILLYYIEHARDVALYYVAPETLFSGIFRIVLLRTSFRHI